LAKVLNAVVVIENEDIEFNILLIDIEEDWKNVIKGLIADSKNPNQGLITEKVFLKKQKQPYILNENQKGAN
jgi:hypothetical protein